MAHYDRTRRPEVDRSPAGTSNAAQAATEELLRWAQRERFTGVGVLRVSFNCGGVTGAKPHTETKIPTEN